jgi:hypothetical protein
MQGIWFETNDHDDLHKRCRGTTSLTSVRDGRQWSDDGQQIKGH